MLPGAGRRTFHLLVTPDAPIYAPRNRKEEFTEYVSFKGKDRS